MKDRNERKDTEAKHHIGTLDLAPKVQVKSGSSANMSKDVKIMRGLPTETVCLS